MLMRLSGAQALLTEGGTEQAADTMVPPSAPAHRGPVPRQGVLLAGERGCFSEGGPEVGRTETAAVSSGGWGSE